MTATLSEKECTKCHHVLPISEFNRRTTSTPRWMSWCKTCTTKAGTGPEANARRYISRKLRWKERVAKINEIKDVPCIDCNGRFPPECMDFDHVTGDKLGNLSVMVRSHAAWDLVLKEIAKCQLVCANCHRIRTASRRQAD